MNTFSKLKISALLTLAVSCSVNTNVSAATSRAEEVLLNLIDNIGKANTAVTDAKKAAKTLQDTVKNETDNMRLVGAQVKDECKQEALQITNGIANQAKQAIQGQIDPIIRKAQQHENNARQQYIEAEQQKTKAVKAAQESRQFHDKMPGIFDQRLAAANATFIQNQIAANRQKITEETAAQTERTKKELEARQQFERENRKENIQAEVDKQNAMLEANTKLEERKGEIARKNEEAAARNPLIQEARQKMAAITAAATETAALNARKFQAKTQAISDERQMALKIKGLTNILNAIGSGLSDKKKMTTVGATFAGTAALYMVAKHGIPLLFDYLVQPKVVSETSKQSLFGSTVPSSEATFDELTFATALQNALNAIAMQLKTAQQFNEALPNILFSGPPGTGKTAFAKALARIKDAEGENIFDYALTTGSQFIKIAVKDLNRATAELRKLIGWAKKGNKPMIIFIDEAESLFANRTSPDTPKYITDMINEFLGLVQDKSQKNLCFIFATNHPFKLDDAILDRVGIKVEFTLPGTTELEKILKTYTTKFANANPDALVKIAPEFTANLNTYAQALVGCAPRNVRFVAEQAISRARRSKPAVLTDSIARTMLKESQAELEKVARWEKERNDFRAKQQAIAVR